MKANIRNISLQLIILAGSVYAAQVQSQGNVEEIIDRAINAAGGADAWENNGYLVVHETQTRYEDEGIVKVNLIHYMNTMAKGYRIELSRKGENYIYGWDGNEYWATADGKAGDHELLREARRVISDGYFRFSLPFILDDSKTEPEYSGKDMSDGRATEVIKITYAQGPADRYFLAAKEEHGHKSGAAEARHGKASGGHGHGGEVYNFHFNQQKQLTKVHFSHHGDGTYETLLLEDFKVVDGISREQKRTLLRPDGQTHYVSEFTSIDFVKEIDAGLFSKP